MNATRRELLKAGLGSMTLLGLGATVPAFLARTARAEAPAAQPGGATNGRVLVVVQLTGGNDGLNTVIPHADPEYLKLRPTLGVKEKFHPLNETLALHPNLAAFKRLYDEGKLAVVNGAGYPNANRSHFRSMEIWHTASPNDANPGGWLGHYLDHVNKGSPLGISASNPLLAVNIGSETPQALIAGNAPVASLSNVNEYGIRTDNQTAFDAELENQVIANLNTQRGESPAMDFLARQATDAILAGKQLKQIASAYKPDAKYTGTPLSNSLLTIAQILAADMGTRIFYCQIGGFDTHSNQMYAHGNLLTQLSDAIAVFFEDMTVKGLADRVAVLCFSEFGRRARENDSRGTDHGAAGPVFLAGPGVKAGVHGAYPSLTELDSGDLKYTTDFRTIYAAILKDWLQADPAKVLPGEFQAAPVFA